MIAMTKITRLTAANVDTLREVDPTAILGATTATWEDDPATVLTRLDGIMRTLPGRSFQRNSLHAVRRKLVALTEGGIR